MVISRAAVEAGKIDLAAIVYTAAAPVAPIAPGLLLHEATAAVTLVQTRNRGMLRTAGFGINDTTNMADEMLARRAGAILALRPELRGHLGAAFASVGIVPIAQSEFLPGGVLPLAMPNASDFLSNFTQEVARRDPPPPDGTADLPVARLSRAIGLPDHLRALLDAPLIAAEIVTGLVGRPDLRTLIQLIALRQADPIWFDIALPAAVQLYLERVLT